MRECLDEGMLQSYFDGELSTSEMERATLHLASCVPCAAAARELEQECSLLDVAFAAEFNAAVPTDRLRRKVEAAVVGLHVVRPVASESGLGAFFGSVGRFLTFSPQRSLGYASLVVVLALAGVFGVVKMKTTQTLVASNPVPVKESVAIATPPVEVAPVHIPEYVPKPIVYRPAKATRAAVPKAPPVKLIPGERSYLQTIAKLDSTIKSQQAMRPALQVEYERNLAVVDRAIAATRSAAKSNPNDPDAADFMFAAYQSKVDLLNTIADARLGGRSH